MALIACPVCNHQISDQARVCPSCGHPIASIAASKSTRGFLSGCLWTAGILALVVLGLLLLMFLRTMAPG